MIKILAVALLLILPAPARQPDTWQGYPCPAGTLHTEVATTAVDGGILLLTVPGDLACGFPGAGRYFGVAVFTPGERSSRIYPAMLQPYAPTAPTVLNASVPVLAGQRIGLCLLPAPGTTLSCVDVSIDPAGGAAATTLPRERWPWFAEVPDTAPEPQCHTCWTASP